MIKAVITRGINAISLNGNGYIIKKAKTASPALLIAAAIIARCGGTGIRIVGTGLFIYDMLQLLVLKEKYK